MKITFITSDGYEGYYFDDELIYHSCFIDNCFKLVEHLLKANKKITSATIIELKSEWLKLNGFPKNLKDIPEEAKYYSLK